MTDSILRTELAKYKARIAELDAENIRLDAEWKKTHEWNNELVKEHYQLKSDLAAAREQIIGQLAGTCPDYNEPDCLHRFDYKSENETCRNCKRVLDIYNNIIERNKRKEQK